MPLPDAIQDWMVATFPRPRLQVGWVEEACKSMEKQLHPEADWEEYTDELENRVLNLPLSAVTINGTSFLPDRIGNKVHTVIQGPIVLELVHMTEVGISTYTLEQTRLEQDQTYYLDLLTLARSREVASPRKLLRFEETLPDYPRRCLSLYLSDGFRELQCLKYRPLPFILRRSSMGIKVRLTNVPVISGVGYLEPDSMEILGGNVPSLEQSHKIRFRQDLQERMVEELALAKTQGTHPKGLFFMDPETEVDAL